MLKTQRLNRYVDAVLDVYRRQGAAAAQDRRREIAEGLSAADAKALRVAVQAAILSGCA